MPYQTNKRADDRRRRGRGDNVAAKTDVVDTDGAGPRLIKDMWNDRRVLNGKNGKGKRVY